MSRFSYVFLPVHAAVDIIITLMSPNSVYHLNKFFGPGQDITPRFDDAEVIVSVNRGALTSRDFLLPPPPVL